MNILVRTCTVDEMSDLSIEAKLQLELIGNNWLKNRIVRSQLLSRYINLDV